MARIAEVCTLKSYICYKPDKDDVAEWLLWFYYSHDTTIIIIMTKQYKTFKASKLGNLGQKNVKGRPQC